MNEEIEKLLNLLNLKGLEYKKYRLEELVKKTKISYENLTSILKELEQEGKVFIDSKGLISSFTPNLIIGKININKNKNGIISYNGKKYRIKKTNMHGLLNLDTIIAKPTGIIENGFEIATLEKIVKRNNGIIVCEVQERYGEKYIIDINNYIVGKIVIPNQELKKYVNGDRLEIRIGLNKENDNCIGEVVSLIGHKDDPDLETNSLLAKYELKRGFSEESRKEEELLKGEITEEDLKDRLDLRKYRNITIDDITCKDRDDSFFIIKTEDNHKKVYINIADPTHYVHPGSAIWKDAEEKTTSVYLYNTSEPMLVRRLSNDICSLNEGVDRLAETLIIEFDENDEIVDYQLTPSVVHVVKNCSYDSVNNLLENGIIEKGYENIAQDIIELNELAEKIYDKMLKRGFLDFPTGDKEITKDENGNIVEIKEKELHKGEKLVEVYMVLADELIPDLVFLPAPYRNHEEPEDNFIDNIVKDLSKMGIKIKVRNNLDPTRQIQHIIKETKGHPLEKTIASTIIKNLKRANYSPDNIGHFGLALKKYLQWTSPIRRFNDFLLHHIIKLQRKLEKENLTQEEYNHITKEIYQYLKKICEIISYKEHQADLAERESFQTAVEDIKNNNNELQNAQITYLNSKFILIKTNDGQEGHLDIGNIYRFNQKNRSYIHKKYKFALQIGNILKVRFKGTKDDTLLFDLPKSEAKKLSLTLK